MSFPKRPALLTLGLLALGTMPGSIAAPRVGQHDGYTRLAFDLPRAATARTVAKGGEVTVTLDAPLKAEGGALAGGDVLAYRVKADGKGSTVTLSLAPGRQAKVFTLPAAGGAPARLVVDIGADVGGPPLTPERAAAAVASKGGGTVQAASTRTPNRPRVRVVLDPGHGGVDPGMVGYIVEKEVTLDVALRVRERLRKRGVEVILTRERDTQISVDKATDLTARANMADAGTVNAFVSIHVNAAGPAAQGIETWMFGSLLDSKSRAIAVRENGGGELGERLTRESANVAQNLLGDLLAQSKLTYSRKLAQTVQRKLIAATGAVNRGLGTAPFAVIRHSRTPAILIELGFGSHPVEGKKLGNEAYRDRLANAIADAIAEFLHVDDDAR